MINPWEIIQRQRRKSGLFGVFPVLVDAGRVVEVVDRAVDDREVRLVHDVALPLRRAGARTPAQNGDRFALAVPLFKSARFSTENRRFSTENRRFSGAIPHQTWTFNINSGKRWQFSLPARRPSTTPSPRRHPPPRTCNHSRDLSIAGMYIRSRLRERSINRRHVYTKQAQREIYQSPACIHKKQAAINTYLLSFGFFRSTRGLQNPSF